MTYHTTEELLGRRSEWAVSPNNFNGLIDSHLLANQRIAELEAQLKGWNKAFQSTDPAIAAERMQNAIDFAKFVGYEDARARYDAKLKAAREALEIARQETRIAAVMLDQVEPSAAITVKESDRLHLAANKMRTVSDLSDKALAALDGEKKGDIDERN